MENPNGRLGLEAPELARIYGSAKQALDALALWDFEIKNKAERKRRQEIKEDLRWIAKLEADNV